MKLKIEIIIDDALEQHSASIITSDDDPRNRNLLTITNGSAYDLLTTVNAQVKRRIVEYLSSLVEA